MHKLAQDSGGACLPATRAPGPAPPIADKGNQFITNVVMAWNGLGLALFDGTCHQNRPACAWPVLPCPVRCPSKHSTTLTAQQGSI